MLVVKTSLWRPAGKTLAAGLLAVASDLPPLALGAGVRRGDALGTSVPVGFTATSGISGGFPRSNSLDWGFRRQWAAPSRAEGRVHLHVWNIPPCVGTEIVGAMVGGRNAVV